MEDQKKGFFYTIRVKLTTDLDTNSRFYSLRTTCTHTLCMACLNVPTTCYPPQIFKEYETVSLKLKPQVIDSVVPRKDQQGATD